MIRGYEVEDIAEMKAVGLSIQAISERTGYDRKTVRKHLLEGGEPPVYGPRPPRPCILDPFQPYLEGRLGKGVWNAEVLLAELRKLGYGGGKTVLKEWLQPKREAATVSATRRFETPPGKQAQADWGHMGYLEVNGVSHKVWGLAITLGYSRRMWSQAALDQKMGTLVRMHEAAFDDWGGVPQEILYDRMKTVWDHDDERGGVVWNPAFLDFARHWGFQPRLCRPYRAQTKGKIESGVKYVRRNFVCGLLGREPSGREEFNAHLRQWLAEVANVRVHGTTHERVDIRFERERGLLQPPDGRTPYVHIDREDRKVARDAYVDWGSSRYSVPWKFVGRTVGVRELDGRVEVSCDAEPIASHVLARGRHQVVTQAPHHAGIPLGADDRGGKILVRMKERAPEVETRPLAAYESLAGGGAR